MDYLLHFETATKVCSVALSLNGELKQLKELQEEGFSHGENLTLFVEDVLKMEGITLKSIKAISLSSGPGSYTGLRIGISAAKGLCYAMDIPLIGIDSLSNIEAQARIKYPGHYIIPMIDARRMEVYCSVYDPTGKLIEPIQAKILDENSFEEYHPVVCCGDGVAKLNELWAVRAIKMDENILSSAAAQVKIAYTKYLRSEFEDLAYMEPFYLKEFGVQ